MSEGPDTYEEPLNASPTEPDEQSEELYERLSLIVDPGQEPLRLDKFLTARMEGASRNKVQQAIETGRVLINNKKVQANHKIKPGEEIVVFSDREIHSDEIIPEEMPLDIVYEDSEVMIIYKPVGLVVHPASGNYSGTLINGVAHYLLRQNGELNQSDLPRFGLVHRIDKNTSGLMVLAKNGKALASLAKQFFDHTVYRQYIALVWGDVEEDSGTVRAHIGRHKRFRKIFAAYPEGDYGKEAVTHYKVLERLGYVTLIQCELETGRTHQIRVHMQHIGHPLFNDELYGGDRIVKGTVFTKYKQFVDNAFSMCPRHALHAKTIGFIHPTTKEQMSFDSVLPADMSNVIEKWRGYAKNKNI
jgi:23S rRNA pseudouridine1911/1915/1917 synthase